MTSEESQQLKDIEEDRKCREEILILALLLLMSDAQRAAVNVAALGGNISLAIQAVLLRPQTGLPSILTQAANSAYHSAVDMSGNIVPGDYEPPRQPTPDEYKGAVDPQKFVDALVKRVAKSVGDEESPDAEKIKSAFDAAGVTEQHQKMLADVAATQVNAGYQPGLFAGWKNNPAVLGYRFDNPNDNHTSLTCRVRIGVQLPKDDPWWDENTPGLHFFCRSTLLALTTPFVQTAKPPNYPAPQPGFGLSQWTRFANAPEGAHNLSMIFNPPELEVMCLSGDDDLTGGTWRTINGAHVYIKGGVAIAGPDHLKHLIGKNERDIDESGPHSEPGEKRSYYDVGHDGSRKHSDLWIVHRSDGKLRVSKPEDREPDQTNHEDVFGASPSDAQGRANHSREEVSLAWAPDMRGGERRKDFIRNQIGKKYPSYRIHEFEGTEDESTHSYDAINLSIFNTPELVLNLAGDDGPGSHWVTVDGQHLLIGGNGSVLGGNPKLIGKHHTELTGGDKPKTRMGGEGSYDAVTKSARVGQRHAASSTDKEFASHVKSAAQRSTARGATGDKALISDVHAQYEKVHGSTPIDSFKRRLSGVNGEHGLNLVREDLVPQDRAGEYAASEVSRGPSRFHYVRTEPRSAESDIGKVHEDAIAKVKARRAALKMPSAPELEVKAVQHGLFGQGAVEHQQQSLIPGGASESGSVRASGGKAGHAPLFGDPEPMKTGNLFDARKAMVDALPQPPVMPGKPSLEVAPKLAAPMHVFKNEEDGTETHVVKSDRGYNVVMKDTDSGSYLPSVSIHPTEEGAIARAKKISRFTEPTTTVAKSQPELSPVDPAHQLGLFAKDKSGAPMEVGEKIGQANLFSKAKYAMPAKPELEVKPVVGSANASDPKHTVPLPFGEKPLKWIDTQAEQVKDAVVHPASLRFTEKDQGDLSRVKEQFGSEEDGYEYVDPVVASRSDDGKLSIIDGHHRAKYAKQAGLPKIRTRTIPEGLYEKLKSKGFDAADIAAGVHNAAGDSESESRTVNQFGGSGGYARSEKVADAIREYESVNHLSLDEFSRESIAESLDSREWPDGNGLIANLRTDKI